MSVWNESFITAGLHKNLNNLVPMMSYCDCTEEDGIDHPVCYFSRKLNKHQRNYSTIEKECLALILALKHFEVYVTPSNQPIIVFSCHNPLVFIHKIKNNNQWLLRWSLMVQEYTLVIQHIKGKGNLIADCLSRI